jgi:hypothetical protein
MTTKMIFEATPEQIDATRKNLLDAIDERTRFEQSLVTDAFDNASILRFLDRYRKHASKLDAFSLGWAASHNFDFISHLNSTRYEGARFNVYAMPKLHDLMRVLNGGSWQNLEDSDAATLAGTVIALKNGVTAGKQIANALDDFMNTTAQRTGYKSGSTQSGSSLRALEAIGAVKKTGARTWEIADQKMIGVLMRAIRKVLPRKEGETE